MAGVAVGQDGPVEPTSVSGAAKLHPETGVDEYADEALERTARNQVPLDVF